METGLLYFGNAKQLIKVKHLFADNYLAYYEGKWRKIHIQVKRLYINYLGKKLTIELN